MTQDAAPMEPDRQSRLFFLGAGFSESAGIPLARELLDLVLDEVGGFQPETHLHRAVPDYVRYVEATTGRCPDPIDIEEFATYLDHRHAFGMLGTDTWSEDGNRDQLLLRWGIGRALHRRTPASDEIPESYIQFARRLRPRDVVVTFNYDVVLERALDVVGLPYRRFPTRLSEVGPSGGIVDTNAESGELLLLKPHGSLDWVSRTAFERRLAYMRKVQGEEGERFSHRRDLLFGDQSCSPTHRLVEGPILDDDPLASIEVIEDLGAYYDTFLVAFEHAPLILAPSQAKQLYGAALRRLWHGLPTYAWAWGGLAIIGYSLPPADPYTRQILYSVVRGYVFGRENAGWRLGPMSRISLVDKRSSSGAIDELREKYRFLPEEHANFRLDGFGSHVLDDLFSNEA